MSESKSLLIEIGCEELPPKSLDELAVALTRGLCEALEKRGVPCEVAKAQTFNSPRRLATLIPNVAATQPDQSVERRGPAVKAGLDSDGNPTKALLGFAASCGVDVARLEKLETDKGAWFVYRAEQKGQPLAALMPEVFAEALKSLPVPKPMRWGDHDFSFVRPVHWLVVMHGDDLIDVELFGIRSGRESRGHRFHHPGMVAIGGADAYVEALRAARVLVDPAERRDRIRAEVETAGNAVGARPRLRDELLDEIANLVEWPAAIACTFDPKFLQVPHEALMQTMEKNQKFFPVINTDGTLTEHFVGIANIESKDPVQIRQGYERVIRPRFADAKFFYDEDLKAPLASYQEGLKSVTYQQQLGSVWDKCLRVAELARVIANRCGVDAALATRAASLCKCDLLTRMVGEFPELQGVMGRYYAQASDENVEVADALDEFYRPRFAADTIAGGTAIGPTVGRVLAIAERLDTLAGIFAVGLKPSGNKDPFALRRAALGLARTLIEGRLDLDLEALVREAVELLPDLSVPGKAGNAKKDSSTGSKSRALDKGALTRELLDFIHDRLRGYYNDQGVSTDQFEAVRAVEPETLLDFHARLEAVAEFVKLPEARALAAANKRIGNILRQTGDKVSGSVDAGLLTDPAEKQLHQDMSKTVAALEPLLARRDYVATLARLAALREPVDRFFDDVMVMVDDPAVRDNRLRLLTQLRRMFLQVADISLLQHD